MQDQRLTIKEKLPFHINFWPKLTHLKLKGLIKMAEPHLMTSRTAQMDRTEINLDTSSP